MNCGINDLPVSIVLSWMEQKAVAILLGLLNLGIKDIWLSQTTRLRQLGSLQHVSGRFSHEPHLQSG